MTMFTYRRRLPRFSSFRRQVLFDLKRLIASVLLAILASAVFPILNLGLVRAQSAQTTLSFVSTTPIIVGNPNGAPVVAKINVNNLTDSNGLGTFGFKIHYDPNLVSVKDTNGDDAADAGVVAAGSFLSTDGRQALCGEGYVDTYKTIPTSKYLNVVCSSYSSTGSPGPTGSGTLATVNFTPGANLGTGTLTIESSELVSNTLNSNLIPHSAGSFPIQIAKCANVTIGDNVVNINDIFAVAASFGKSSINSDWANHVAKDLDRNNAVNINDIFLTAYQFARTC